ncbi:MAG: DNA polymerase I [Spirochaetales bacterium]|nr:DNA polymerase I [Spirochaetales bacterium]
MNNAIYLVDGYGLIYRSYFALIRNPLKNSRGENTSAVFGFLRSLVALINSEKPEYLGVILDSKKKTFRHERYPEYKATRQKAPDDLHPQVDKIEKILKAWGIPAIRHEGYEADDVIASVCRYCGTKKIPCYILSKDKDLFQLVDENVKILYPDKSGEGYAVWGKEEIHEKKGIYPEQVISYLSLTGDSSDNIPGVKGIGDKTAVQLISKFGDLDSVYANLDGIKSESQKNKLVTDKENAYLSRELVTLYSELPVDGPDSFKLKPPNRDHTLALLHDEDIRIFDSVLGGEKSYEAGLASIKPGMYETVLSVKSLDEWLGKIKKSGIFAFDVETDNVDAMVASPIGFSLATGKGIACYIPIKAIGIDCLDAELVKEKLKTLLEDASMKLVGQNIKYDYKVMRRWGIQLKNIYFDTMVAAWVLDSSMGTYNMDYLAERYLSYKTVKYSDLIARGEDNILADLHIEQVTDYAAEDADITFRLYEKFSGEFSKRENEDLYRLFIEIEMPIVQILSEMELAGIRILKDQLKKYSKSLNQDLALIEDKIYKECGTIFNIRSTKELQKILFEDRKLKPIKKTKTGYSTDARVLEELSYDDIVAGMVLEHRILSKLKSTYVDTLPEQVNPVTGRLHTQFLQTGTATGRLSSNNPNLQNIPVKDERGREIRCSFVPDEGNCFVSADYSQIELVLLAHLSNDEKLIPAFKADADIHTHTTSLIFSVAPDEVTKEQRRIGKMINYGVIYGMSGFRLARELKISRKDADAFIEAYFREYKGVREFRERTIKEAEQRGYVSTLYGRRRYLPGINDRNKTIKMAEERIAVNSPIQGSAADVVKLAMIKIVKELQQRKLKCRLLLQVHDELIFEVPNEELDEVKNLVKQGMEHVIDLKIPLKVALEHGDSWGAIH